MSDGSAGSPFPPAAPIGDRVVTPGRVDDDTQFEAGLRPRLLDDYIGQDRIRENLDVSITAARGRSESLDHVLLYGPPGLGKTTLAYVIGNEMGVRVCATAGPVIEKPGDLAGDRRDPLSGDGRLRARYRHRPGTGGALGQGSAQEIHVDRSDDARGVA